MSVIMIPTARYERLRHAVAHMVKIAQQDLDDAALLESSDPNSVIAAAAAEDDLAEWSRLAAELDAAAAHRPASCFDAWFGRWFPVPVEFKPIDPDNPPLTDEQLDRMRPSREVVPAKFLDAARRRRSAALKPAGTTADLGVRTARL